MAEATRRAIARQSDRAKPFSTLHSGAPEIFRPDLTHDSIWDDSWRMQATPHFYDESQPNGGSIMKKSTILAGIIVSAIAHLPAFAQASNPCPRFSAGSMVADPPSLFSSGGVLDVTLAYRSGVDADGRTLYCLTTPDGKESPTLHVSPGDRLIVNVTNTLPQPVPSAVFQVTASGPTLCGATSQDASSMNIHYHGTNTSPGCHGDDVIHTLINSGKTFTYNLQFPLDEPAGLYWYHPHVHGLAEGAVLGGATGAIVVDGIQNVQHAVAGIPQRILIVRDQIVAGNPTPGGSIPSWDLSVNYVPIAYPATKPAVIVMRPGQKELWRVANSAADSILDLQLQYDGKPQTLQVVALDGVPTGSQDGTRQGTLVPQTHILIPPAGRVEFIVTGPDATVKTATLMTLNIETGPSGDNDPTRPLIAIHTDRLAPLPALIPAVSAAAVPQRFEGLTSEPVTANRKLYFSEVISNPADPSSPTNFFITVNGATPKLFSSNDAPSIVTKQGSVEDWTIENRATERHEFHFHQIHFLLLERNGVPVAAQDQQFLDMVDVPFWSGTGPYPSVKVRMDFRGPDVGDFVYHCHILGHEDNGMMAIIRVLPR
jgi:FtsP/CotA-like multicopper oxidase with cupredoxin domain